MTTSTPYLFYAFDGPANLPRLPVPGGLIARWWHPRLHSVRPPGFTSLPFAVWWGFHHVRLFSNREYALLGVYDAGLLVQRTCVFPRYFRFPFMDRGDLQIGDVWTHPSHRGQGLAAWALHEALRQCAQPRRTLWYVVHEQNSASVQLAEKCDFVFRGRGCRVPRLGLQPLGAYHLTELSSSTTVPHPQAA